MKHKELENIAKLGDLEAMEKLKEMRDSLPRLEPEEKRDPTGVAIKHLFTLYDMCIKSRHKLPKPLREHLKVTVAAVGRIHGSKKTNAL